MPPSWELSSLGRPFARKRPLESTAHILFLGQNGTSLSKPISEPKGHIQPTQVQVLPCAEVKRRRIVRVIVAKFGTDHQHIVKLMAQPDGVARVGGRKARPLALLIPPHLVTERKIVSLGDREHRVVDYPIGV